MSEREQVWREWIEWQRGSGLTVAECCEEAGVRPCCWWVMPQRPCRLLLILLVGGELVLPLQLQFQLDRACKKSCVKVRE